MLGSILANAVLLTGACFIAGGVAQHSTQFNRKTVFATSAALLVVVLALSVPTAYTVTTPHQPWCPMRCVLPETLAISRWTSILLIGCYAVHLYWSIVTHPAPLADGEAAGAATQLSLHATLALTASTT
eukprot:2817689-Prymnesium_polylepis.1